jgi:nicotinamidase-related amidase
MLAHIIIDMQEASFENSDKHDTEGTIARINRISETVRSAGGKVIFIQHDGTPGEGLEPFTPGWEVLSSLSQMESDIAVRKTVNDVFSRSELASTLDSLNVSNLIISGWATDFCVDSTIRSAVSRGYNVVVASDGHTVSDRPHMVAPDVITHHNWLWQNLQTHPGRTIEVLSCEEICRGLQSLD